MAFRFGPETWGSNLWFAIHTWALSYPLNPSDADRFAAAAYFNNLPNLIPCPKCGSDFAAILLMYPVENALDSRADLVEWSWRVHNIVNQKIGKAEIAFETFLSNYGVVNGFPSFSTHVSGAAIKAIYRAFW